MNKKEWIKPEIETWKDIPGYEGVYRCSDKTRIMSLKRKYVRENRILNLWYDNHGYLSVGFNKNNKLKIHKVHQLMGICFLGHNPQSKNVVDHIDNNKKNNNLNNLQIITHRVNTSKDKKNKTSQYTGVSWSSSNNKYKTQITIENKQIHLGVFDDDYEAFLMYEMAKMNIGNLINPLQFRELIKNKIKEEYGRKN